ncbi:MAG TPA: hypothetical protein VIU61_03175 [Kofleriaceae bacterium]
MAEVVQPAPQIQRREFSRQRRRRDEVWIAATAMVAAMLVLPLAQSSWHGPEVASVLAVAATALFAGQRWAIAVIVIAELLLVPTIWPRAFFADHSLALRMMAFGSLIAVVPGLLAMRRAAAALVLVGGWRRTRSVCRRFQIGLVLMGVVASMLPLL